MQIWIQTINLFSMQTLLRRKNDQLREGQSTSSHSQQNCANANPLVSVWPVSSGSDLAQDNQLLTRCSHPHLDLAYSLFVKKRLIPEVCTICSCMCRTLLYDISTTMRGAIPRCVTDIYFASSVRWDKPGSSLLTNLMYAHCESAVMLSVNQPSFCSDKATVMMTFNSGITRQQPATCHVSSHTAAAPLFSRCTVDSDHAL